LALTGSFATSTPKMAAWPDVGVRRPVRRPMAVVFPAPFGPTSAKTVPAATRSVRPSRAVSAPYRFVAPSKRTAF
jgi:hypothetical protein